MVYIISIVFLFICGMLFNFGIFVSCMVSIFSFFRLLIGLSNLLICCCVCDIVVELMVGIVFSKLVSICILCFFIAVLVGRLVY